MGVKKHSDLTSQADLHVPKLHESAHELGGTDAMNLTDVGTTETSVQKVLKPTGANKTEWTDTLNLAGNITTDEVIIIGQTKAFYIGDTTTDGSWRIIRNSPSGANDLVLQKRITGAYVSQASFPTSATGNLPHHMVSTTMSRCDNTAYHQYADIEHGRGVSLDGDNNWGNPSIDSTNLYDEAYATISDEFVKFWIASGSYTTHMDSTVHSVRCHGFFESATAVLMTAYLWKFKFLHNSGSTGTTNLTMTCVGKINIDPLPTMRTFNETGTVSSVIIPAGYGLAWSFRSSLAVTHDYVMNITAKIVT